MKKKTKILIAIIIGILLVITICIFGINNMATTMRAVVVKVKEKSDIEIPDNILRYCYSSRDNVTVTVSEITKTGISLTIKDTNEIPYSYSNSYTIYKKVKNKDYTGVGYQIGENTGNSTAGYTRNRT